MTRQSWGIHTRGRQQCSTASLVAAIKLF